MGKGHGSKFNELQRTSPILHGGHGGSGQGGLPPGGVTTIAGPGCVGVTAPMIGTLMPHTD